MDVSFSDRRTQIALGLSFALNLVLVGVIAWPDSEPETAATEPAAIAQVEPAVEVEPAAEAPADEPPAEAAAEVPEPAKVEVVETERKGVQVTVATVKGSIPQTLGTAAKPYGDFLSATLSRLLVWDHDLRKDLRAGDKIETSWHLGTSDTVVVESARFHSLKFNRTTTAYRFQTKGDKYPSYWSAEGVELPHRLKKSPLATYDQITSLLRDRPNHKGMDFKVAVGTPVAASFSGKVTRVNWNWKYNGNCIEIQHKDGALTKYLHLSRNKVKAGDQVTPGQVIALSGNTGKSTGPHLHYQINKGKKVIDPIDYHGTIRRNLPESDKAAFGEVVKSANALLDAGQI